MDITSINNISRFRDLSVRMYFDAIGDVLVNDIRPDEFLNMVNDNSEFKINNDLKPDFNRWIIKSDDIKFSEVYLIFNDDQKINSVVWFLSKTGSLSLSELVKILGKAEMENVIYDETTLFKFSPKQFKGAYASYNGWLKKTKKGFKDAQIEEPQIIIDPELSHVSFSI